MTTRLHRAHKLSFDESLSLERNLWLDDQHVLIFQKKNPKRRVYISLWSCEYKDRKKEREREELPFAQQRSQGCAPTIAGEGYSIQASCRERESGRVYPQQNASSRDAVRSFRLRAHHVSLDVLYTYKLDCTIVWFFFFQKCDCYLVPVWRYILWTVDSYEICPFYEDFGGVIPSTKVSLCVCLCVHF